MSLNPTVEHVLEVGYTTDDDGIWLDCRKRDCLWRAQVEGNEFFPSPEELMELAQQHYAEVERAERVEQVEHSGEMAGLHVDEETKQDAVEYVAGTISADELVRRVRVRYGRES